jgi:hypothetical protein
MVKLGMLIAALIIVFSPVKAHAYLDPGTGSYIIQMAIAGAVSALFAIKIFWKRLKEKLHGIFRRNK